VTPDFSQLAGDLAPGDRVASYLIQEQIGVGGMAVVFRALDLRLDRQVALKVLIPELARDETEADVRAFAVAPQGQGQGVGRSLLQAVIERADKRGLRRLRLCTNPVMRAAQHLYETTGFSRTPDLDWSPAPGLILRAYELALPILP